MTLKYDYFRSICVTSISIIAIASTVTLTPAFAQQIVPDGYTKTNLNVSGNTTNVTTGTIKGANAFNSFSKFNVNKGNVVNLVVPGKANNLINVVKDQATNIDGTLNALKNGKVGGNVLLVNPYGVVVGADGVVNVGSLTTVTPTKDFVDNFFDSPGNPNASAVKAVLNGTAPKNPDAPVIIDGVINAVSGEKLFYESKVDTKDVVNTGNLDQEGSLIIKDGQIKIASGENGIIPSSPIKPFAIDDDPPGPVLKSSLGIIGTTPLEPVPTKEKLSGATPLPPVPMIGENENGAPMPPIPTKERFSGATPLPPIPMIGENENGNPIPPIPSIGDNKQVGPIPPIPTRENLSGTIPLPPVPTIGENYNGAPLPPIPSIGENKQVGPIPPIPFIGDNKQVGPIPPIPSLNNDRGIVTTGPVKPNGVVPYEPLLPAGGARGIVTTGPVKPNGVIPYDPLLPAGGERGIVTTGPVKPNMIDETPPDPVTGNILGIVTTGPVKPNGVVPYEPAFPSKGERGIVTTGPVMPNGVIPYTPL